MKKPVIKYDSHAYHFKHRRGRSYYQEGVDLDIAVMKFKRGVDKSYIGRFFNWILRGLTASIIFFEYD